MADEHYYPKEETLGRDCTFWDLGRLACSYPKVEMENRRSCEGIIDDVCLFLKNGRHPSSLSEAQIKAIKSHPQDLYDKSYLPPGDIK